MFDGILNFLSYLMLKSYLVEDQYWYYLTQTWEDWRVYIFSKDISPKVNIIVQLEFELAYFDIAVQLFSYYASGIPSYSF